MAKKKFHNRTLSIIGGVFILLLLISIAWASYYISSQLATKDSVAPNAPESKPAASLCIPGNTYCNGPFAYRRCNTTGSGWSSSGLCPNGCFNNKCLSFNRECGIGDKRCSGNTIQTCSALGKWVNSETCKNGCFNNKCITQQVCTPGVKKCVGSDLQVCNNYGGGYQLLSSCTYGCDAATTKCKVCIPGSRFCSGNNLQICNSTGSALNNYPCGIGKACVNLQCVSSQPPR